MTSRHRILAVVAGLLAVVADGQAQGTYGTIAPPIPSGPPLPPPPADIRTSTWIEDGPAMLPAAGWSPNADAVAAPETAWPVAHSGSSCHFDSPEPAPSWILIQPTWMQVLQGAYFTSKLGPGVPALNYVPLSIRHGWNLGNASGPGGLFPGNWEFVLDVTGAAIMSSYGNWLAGPSAFLRYNWAETGSRFVPYAQAGAGILVNDAYRDVRQRAIGQAVEFCLHAELGLRCFVTPSLSLDIEGGLQHISNAGSADRNSGINAFGGSVGLTYYFPWGTQ